VVASPLSNDFSYFADDAAMAPWIIDSIGMLGTFLVVLAYFLLQLERTDPKGISYNLINLFGALFLMISLCFNFNLASFVIEIFWITASLIGLWKYLRRQPGTPSAGRP
jgi:predicted membrane protein